MIGKIRNRFVLIALLASISALGTGQAIAEGAVAEGIAPGGVARGYAVGHVVNRKDTDTAKADALAICKKHQSNVSGTPEDSGSLAAIARCKMVATFHNKCFAAALDPKDATPGAGWAIRDTQQEADDEALARCRNTAGADRSAFCKVFNRACDGSAK